MNTSLSGRIAAFGAATVFAVALAGCEQREATQVSGKDVRATARDDIVAVEPAEPNLQTPGVAGGLEVFITTGRIESIDRDAGKVVITHDAVASANMPQGTTEFVARDSDPLALLKPGQRIEFNFARLTEGGYTITSISPTPPEE